MQNGRGANRANCSRRAEIVNRIRWPDPYEYNEIFNLFFLAECICKIIALGFFFGSKSYLSTSWNWLDFVVVITGTLELLKTGSHAGNLSALRLFRVLRPLRMVTKVREMRFLVTVILRSVPELGSVFVLIVFLCFVFGIIGVQLFQGATRGACYDIDDGTNTGTSPCSMFRRASDDPIQDQIFCPSSQECLSLAMAPNGCVTNFDNILSAFINNFQVMTQQGWTDILYALQASLSFHVWIYFVALNFIGPCFVVKLFLVVICKNYVEVRDRDEPADKPLHIVKSIAKNRVFPEPYTATEAELSAGAERRNSECLISDVEIQEETAATRNTEAASAVAAILHSYPAATRPVIPRAKDRVAPEPYTTAEAELSAGEVRRYSDAGSSNDTMDSSLDIATNDSAGPECQTEGAEGAHRPDRLLYDDTMPSDQKSAQKTGGHSVLLTSNRGCSGEVDSQSQIFQSRLHLASRGGWLGRLARRVRGRLAALAASTTLEYMMMATITVNTLLMAIDADCEFCDSPTCARQKGAVELSNLAFTSIFTTESVLKLACFGPMSYLWLMAPMSWLDVGIVVSNLVEIPSVMTRSACYLSTQHCAGYDTCEAKGSASVLRILRLARIIRLLSRFTNLNLNQICAIAKSFRSVLSLFFLIVIFIAIFMALGMNYMPGLVLQPWNAANLMRGMQVFVTVPGDDMGETTFPVPGRPATLLGHEFSNQSWHFCFNYVTPKIISSQGFGSCLWADVVDSAGMNIPAIVGAVERDNFDSPGIAFLTTLGILTKSNWNSQYYNAKVDFGLGIVIYYIVWIFVGNWVLVNMFTAILLYGISGAKYSRQEVAFAIKIEQMFFGLSEEALVRKIKFLFNKVDSDGSGLIDIDELEDVLVAHCELDLGRIELIRLFQKYGDDDTGRINEEEFENMIKNFISTSEKTLRKLHLNAIENVFGGLSEDMIKVKAIEMFDQADRDYSGYINKEEVGQLLASHDIELMPWDLSRYLFKFGNGTSSDKISKTGFTQMIALVVEDYVSNNKTLQKGSLISRLASSIVKRLCALHVTTTVSKRKLQDVTASPHNSLREFNVKDRVEQLQVQGETAAPSFAKARESEQQMSWTRERLASNSDSAQAEAAENMRVSSLKPVLHLSNASAENLGEDAGARLSPEKERSLIILSKNNKFRRTCIKIVNYPPSAPDSGKYVDKFIFILIVMSSCLLAFENPRIGSDSQERVYLERLNIFLNLAFLCECCLKIVADSFASYLRSGWSRLDLFIVVTSTVHMTMTYLFAVRGLSLLKALRILRILQVLRLLRLMARARNLCFLTSALWASIIRILRGCSIAILAYFVCSILGMQLLKGIMKTCSDPNFIEKKDCLANFDENGSNLQWISRPVNWDNLINGMVAMFILTSQDNWQNYMWAGTDAISRTEGPMANANLSVAMFYVFCLLVSCYLVIILFINTVVDAYFVASSNMLLSESSEVEASLRAKFRQIPQNVTDENRVVVLNVVTANVFGVFIAFCIVANIVAMAFESYKQASWQTKLGDVTQIFFSLVFGWECIFKIIAFYPKLYYQDGWNRFDFFTVSISFGAILIDGLGPSSVPVDPRLMRVLRLFRVFRILRAFRFFRILKSARNLTRILGTLIKSIPELLNLLILLAMVFFIFAVLGVSIFGNLCVAGENSAPGLEGVRCFFSEQNPPLDPKVNFRDVGHSLMTLLRVATLDGWSELMFSVLISPVRKQITPITWVHYLKLNGSETGFDALGPPQDVDYMSVVKRSLAGWKDSVKENGTFLSDVAGWPYPNRNASEWACIAKSILSNCITDNEASSLEAAGLMECTTLGRKRQCSSTCSDPLTGTIFFAVFIVTSAFVLMHLVTGVLLKVLMGTRDQVELHKRIPGCERLRLKVFERMSRRWRYSALAKLKAESVFDERHQNTGHTDHFVQ